MMATIVLDAGPPASAQGAFEDGMAASEREDYLAAIHHWEPLANSGNAQVMYNLALAHFRHYLHVDDRQQRTHGVETGWVWMQLAERFGILEARGEKEKHFGRWFPGEMEQRVNHRVDGWMKQFCSNHPRHEECLG